MTNPQEGGSLARWRERRARMAEGGEQSLQQPTQQRQPQPPQRQSEGRTQRRFDEQLQEQGMPRQPQRRPEPPRPHDGQRPRDEQPLRRSPQPPRREQPQKRPQTRVSTPRESRLQPPRFDENSQPQPQRFNNEPLWQQQGERHYGDVQQPQQPKSTGRLDALRARYSSPLPKEQEQEQPEQSGGYENERGYADDGYSDDYGGYGTGYDSRVYNDQDYSGQYYGDGGQDYADQDDDRDYDGQGYSGGYGSDREYADSYGGDYVDERSYSDGYSGGQDYSGGYGDGQEYVDGYGGYSDGYNGGYDEEPMAQYDTAEEDTIADLYPEPSSDFANLDSIDEPDVTRVDNGNERVGFWARLKRMMSGTYQSKEHDRDVELINRPFRKPQVIGVMGSKGGVGKTSKTQIIGSIIARYRTSGGVVAADLDANSTLIQRMDMPAKLPAGVSISTFADDKNVRTQADVSHYVVLNEEKLAVLAGVGMTSSKPLTTKQLMRVLHKLGEFYQLIILDFPGSAEVPVAVQALRVIDAMVYVAEITKTSLSSTKRDLKRISQQRPELLATATIILNHRTAGKVLVKDLDKHVADFQRMGTRDAATGTSRVKVFETNYDPHIAMEGAIHLDRLDPVNRERYLHIAARIVESLPGTIPAYEMAERKARSRAQQQQREEQGGQPPTR